MTDAQTTPFHRVLLKLSGEVFGGGAIGLDPAVVAGIAKQIAEATAKEENKPAQAVPRIVEGRVNSFYKDVVLLDQPSVTDNKTPVSKLLDAAGVKITRFVRFEAAS